MAKTENQPPSQQSHKSTRCYLDSGIPRAPDSADTIVRMLSRQSFLRLLVSLARFGSVLLVVFLSLLYGDVLHLPGVGLRLVRHGDALRNPAIEKQ